MKRKLSLTLAVGLALMATLLFVFSASANPPAPGEKVFVGPVRSVDGTTPGTTAVKPLDQPNPKDYWRNQQRQRMLEAGQVAEANSLALTGSDRVLVVLVEFAGTDTFTWTQGTSQWDPYGRSNPAEAVLNADGSVKVGDCSNIITETKTFTYAGPLHNKIPRPLSDADRSGQSIWTEDFSNGWFNAFMFGAGVKFQYARQDGSVVNEDFTGKSVKKYFQDMSAGQYSIGGDVIGWLQLPHSTWWYGADKCPGNRSGMSSGAGADGGIPGAGGNRSMVRDALDAVNAISNTIPGFAWKNYDQDGDGVIDRLWIVHAGYGEEDGATLLDRTDYGEAANWSHSSSVSPLYPVSPDVKAGPYIMMPENGGIGVFAHESAHNLGASDLYAYGNGYTSTGFWALQADDWTGYPIGFEPPAVDPWHLDNWGWLNPLVANDATAEYIVTVGQASSFPGGEGVVRGVKIPLPNGAAPLPAQPWQGTYYWWGGKADLANGKMTTKNPIAIPTGSPASLSFDLLYDIEPEWDFLWIQASEDGTTWQTLTNTHTSCVHDPSWIGELYGFPADLCAAGIGGFTGHNTAPTSEVFDLSAFAGKSIWLRFWYMTDWGTTGNGPFVDMVQVKSGASVLFSDDAESGDAKWTYVAPWQRNSGTQPFTHNLYLQWRNVSKTGGYDESLGDARWRFGPANTGLLVWYNNNFYNDNEIFNYLTDFPGYGAKGRMLVVDAHPEPYRYPDLVAAGYNNEGANLTSRGQMRDAPFSLNASISFTNTDPYGWANVPTPKPYNYPGRPAVSAFHDAWGYYPGAEFVPGGPVGQTSKRWMTKQWDASTVVPAKQSYGVKAPGYNGTDRFRYGCSTNAVGQVLCYSYASGLGYAGGSGNPGDIAAQYGWHVQILSQTEQTATLKIWNSMFEFDGAVTQTPNATPLVKGGVVKVGVKATNVGSPLNNGFVFLPLSAGVEYVPGSVYGGAFPLTAAMAAELQAKQGIAVLAGVPEGVDAEKVVGVGWMGSAATGAMMDFGFSVQVTAESGKVHHTAAIFNNYSHFVKDLSGDTLDIQKAQEVITKTFAAVADTSLESGQPTINFGNWTYLYVGANDSVRDVLKFDLSAIDPAYPVEKATLSLYIESYSGGGSPAQLGVYEVVTGWAENTATWKTPWTVPGGDYISAAAAGTPIEKTAVGTWKSFDITPLVQKWVWDPAKNLGATVKLVNATSYTVYRLASREYWVPANAPKLEVTYVKP